MPFSVFPASGVCRKGGLAVGKAACSVVGLDGNDAGTNKCSHVPLREISAENGAVSPGLPLEEG